MSVRTGVGRTEPALSLFVVLSTVALGLFPSIASASTVLYRTDAQLVALSERVVHARVLGSRFERPVTDGAIYTVTALAVLEDLTGVPGDTVEVWELGGVADNELMFVGGAVLYEPGSEVLVCLGRGRFGLRSVAMGFSKFDVAPTTAPDGSADGRLTRNMRDTSVVGGAASAPERSLAEFRALVSAVRGVSAIHNSSAATLAPDEQVSEAFTLLTFSNGLGPRWKQADSGTPVKYYRNTAHSSPLQSGNIDTEIQRALSAWTAPPTATIALQLAGTVNQADPYAQAAGGGNTVISFEDPNEEITNPTLAIGGGFASFNDGGTVSGTTFNRFTRGYVIFQNAADLSSSFRSPQDFSRVLEHEVGHTIGLGHSPDPSAIMYASCCLTTTPIVPALGADDLAGVNFIYPSSTTSACSFAISPASLSVDALAGSGSVNVIAPTGCAWTATSNASFVSLNASGGTGNGTLTFTIAANTSPSQRIATLTIAGQTVTITQAGAAAAALPPFGVVETPLDNATGVTGSIPVTGWALDDVKVVSVKVYRDPVPGEAASSLVYIGDATFVPGARPDVAAAYPTTPFNTQAGWGYLLLTNVLPNAGTGAYRLSIYATDREGNQALLGTRLITCTNNTAITPFGAIDTPEQGEVVSSANYNNFGWVLSLGTTRSDPPGGGTVRVVIDGVAVGSPTGWTSRSDISTLFPAAQYAGVNTALGVYTFSTSALANGVHTIAWSVTDNLGGTAGVGSRYFTVSKSAPATGPDSTATVAASVSATETARVLQTPLAGIAISGRRGFDFDAPLHSYHPDANGVVTIDSEEVDRIELQLGASPSRPGSHAFSYAGYERTAAGLTPLPVGSSLNSESGEFTWQPGVGFLGAYEFEFVQTSGGHAVARQEIRIVLNPKGSGRVGPQIVIDTPSRQQDVGQPFVVAGWAVDLDDQVGTGIDALHVWAYPLRGGNPVFLGSASYGGQRQDVAALLGDRFATSGYSLTVQGLSPGNYDLAVFGWSTVARGFVAAKTVRVTVR